MSDHWEEEEEYEVEDGYSGHFATPKQDVPKAYPKFKPRILTHDFNFCDFCETTYSPIVGFTRVKVRCSNGDIYAWMCAMCMKSCNRCSEEIWTEFNKTIPSSVKAAKKPRKKKRTRKGKY